jgi:monothiol glutaredoxin
MSIETTITKQIGENDILLYMKGSPEAPMCGFSSRVVKALQSCGEPFAFVDILENPEIRATLPKIANWPTFPQLYLKGDLIGGCDIVCELYEDGELQTMVKAAAGK